MMPIFQIVHVKSDGSEKVIGEVRSPTEVKAIVDTSDYQGTWLTDTRKLLRYRRGEIVIRLLEEVLRPYGPEISHNYEIVNKEIVHWKKFDALKLQIANGGNLHWLMLTPSQIIAYDMRNTPLWTCDSFSELCEMCSKKLAFEVAQIHENYLNSFGYQSAI